MTIEQGLKEFFDSLHIRVPVSREDRLGVALMFGYVDVKNMVFFKETYGLPLDMMLMQMRKKFPKVKVDYSGLEHELLMIGTNEGSVKSQLEELRIADREMEDA
jgi:hypothetical protein